MVHSGRSFRTVFLNAAARRADVVGHVVGYEDLPAVFAHLTAGYLGAAAKSFPSVASPREGRPAPRRRPATVRRGRRAPRRRRSRSSRQTARAGPAGDGEPPPPPHRTRDPHHRTRLPAGPVTASPRASRHPKGGRR
jgi:hypothetical protein